MVRLYADTFKTTGWKESVLIEHGLDTRDCQVALYRPNGGMVFGDVTIVDSNTVELAFAGPGEFKVVVVG